MPHVYFHYKPAGVSEAPGLSSREVDDVADALPGICARPLSDETSTYSEHHIVVLPMPISMDARNARVVMLDIFRTSRDRSPGEIHLASSNIAGELQELLPELPDGSISVWIVGEEGGFSFR